VAGALAAWAVCRTPALRFVEYCPRDPCPGIRHTSNRSQMLVIARDEQCVASRDPLLSETSPVLVLIVRHRKQGGVAAIGLELLVPEKLAPREAGRARALGTAL